MASVLSEGQRTLYPSGPWHQLAQLYFEAATAEVDRDLMHHLRKVDRKMPGFGDYTRFCSISECACLTAPLSNVSKNRIVKQSRGHMRFMIKEKGGVNAAVFIEFLKRMIASRDPACEHHPVSCRIRFSFTLRAAGW